MGKFGKPAGFQIRAVLKAAVFERPCHVHIRITVVPRAQARIVFGRLLFSLVAGVMSKSSLAAICANAASFSFGFRTQSNAETNDTLS